MQVISGKIKRLIVNMPPRHGKTEFLSKYCPAWFMGRFPDKKVIIGTYEATLAEQWGFKSRSVIEKWGEAVFGIRLSKDMASRKLWGIEDHEGTVQSCGVMGPMTGRGCDLMIIDDPIKGAEQANSKVIRDKIWDWWDSVASTRFDTPEAAVIVIQTRWHQDDLTGRLISEDRDQEDQKLKEGWHVVNLPAIAEEDDALKRKPGEALWPERWPIEYLRKREAKGSYWWNALYQGRPVAAGGGMFKQSYFKYYTTEGDFIFLWQQDDTCERIHKSAFTFFQIVDTAMEVGKDNDYTVIMTLGCGPQKQIIVWDVMREKLEVPDQWNAIKKEKRKYGNFIRFQAVERKGSGHGIIQTARRNGVRLKPLEAIVDKVTRAFPASIAYETGQVYHPQSRRWVADLEDELCSFPKGTHDDMVDVIAYAARCIEENMLSSTLPVEIKEKIVDDGGNKRNYIELDKPTKPFEGKRFDISGLLPSTRD